MQFGPSDSAGPDEIASYLTWRDRYADDVERCRRYERVRRASLTKRWSGYLDGWMVRRALADLPPGARVLDLPCGGGRISRALRRAGYHTLAADYSRWMLVESAESADLRTRADALRLPFRDAAFDAAVSFRFMHSLPRELRLRALRELSRVAGRVVVSHPHVYSLRSLRRFLLGGGPPDNRLTESQLRREVEAAGLSVVAFHYKARLFFEDFVVVARRARDAEA